MAYINGKEILFSATICNHDKQLESSLSKAQKQLQNLEVFGVSVTEQTDSTVAYQKTVPANVLPYAEVTEIGGMTYRKEIPPALASTVEANSNIEYWFSESITPPATFVFYLKNTDSAEKKVQANFNASVYIKMLTLPADGAFHEYKIEIPGGIESMDAVSSMVILDEGYNIPTGVDAGTLNIYQGISSFYLEHSAVSAIKSDNADGTLASLVIPEAVRKLDGYGWGIPDASYNKIEWKPDEGIKRFLKTIYICTVTGKEGDWSVGTFNGIQRFYSLTLSNMVEQTSATRLLCADFTNIPNLNQYGNAYVTSGGGGSLRFCVDPAQCNGVDEWVDYLQKRFEEGNPLVFLYSASTAEVTDISNLLLDDNMIAVESGGTLTAVNENGNAIPTSITYGLKS